MKNSVAIGICLILLGYGLVRLGVGSAMLAQVWGLIDLQELSASLTEVTQFLSARADAQLIPLGLTGFLSYIVAMGGLLAAGAIGVIRFKRWGFVLLGAYIAAHAALFVNYQEVNPKLFLVALQIVFFVTLLYLRPPRRCAHSASAA